MGRGIAVLDEGPRRAMGRGGVGVFGPHFHNGKCHWVKCFRFVCENLRFPFGKRIIESSIRGLFGDIFNFQIKVGVYKILAKK